MMNHANNDNSFSTAALATMSNANNNNHIRKRSTSRSSTCCSKQSSFPTTSMQLLLTVALLMDSGRAFQAQTTRGTGTFDVVGRNPSAATRVHYRDNADRDTLEETQQQLESSVAAGTATSSSSTSSHGRWWNPLAAVKDTTKSSKIDDDETDVQASVDDYLQFLEKRYSRLYEDDDFKQNKAKFSAWAWIHSTGEADHVIEDAIARGSTKENSWFALNAAGDAGQRLLQKYHGSSSLSPAQDQAQVTTEGVTQTQLSADTIVYTSVVASKFSAMFRVLKEKRDSLLRFESEKLNNAAIYFVKVMIRAPVKASKALWNMGGGKKTLAVSFTVAAAVSMVLLKPIMQTILLDSTGIRRG